MRNIFVLILAILLFGQVINAQIIDAKDLPLRIQNNAGSNGWSPDGKLFATYTRSEEKTRLWNLEDETVIWEVSLENSQKENEKLNYQTFIWGRNQKYLIVRDERGKIYLLNPSNGKVIWKNKIKDNVEIIRFNPNEKQIVLVFSEKTEKAKIEFWNAETGKLENSFTSDVNYFDSFAFSTNGKVLKFGNFEGKAKYINAENGKIIEKITLKPCSNLKDKYSQKTKFSPNLKYLVARCDDKTVITDVETAKVLSILNMRTDYEKTIGFSGDEKVMILEDLGYKIFNFSDGSVKDIEDPDLWFSVDLNYDGSLFFHNTDYQDRGYAIVEVQTGKVIKNFENHPGEIKNLVFNAYGNRFASASSDGIVRVWNTESRKILWANFANNEGTNAVAFSPDGKMLVSTGDDENDKHSIKVWDAENGKLLHEIPSEKDGNDGIKRIVFSPDGKLLLTTGDSVVFKLWDTENWKVLQTFQTYEEHRSGNMGWCCGSKAFTLSFDKSGKRILSAHEDGTIKFWEVGQSAPIKIFQISDRAIRAYFSPDEKQILVIGDNTATTILIDAESGNVIQEFKTGNPNEELDYVTDAAFRNNGKSFFTTSWFDDVMLWDASNGDILKRINVGWSTNDEVELSPNGKYLLAGGENQNIMLFDSSNSELIWSLFPIDKEIRRSKQAQEDERIASLKRAEESAATADIDNEKRIKKITVKFSHYGDGESFWDQKIAESGVPDKSKLKKSKDKATVAWFTLTNDADLPVTIDTNSMYLNPKCKGLCAGSEISSRYVLELKNGETNVNGFDMFSNTILPTKTTVYFSVSLEHIADSKAIYLGFTFQKDNPDDDHSNDFGTEQKVYVDKNLLK